MGVFIVPDTKRLQFELMSEKDLHLFHELDKDPLVMQHINGGKPRTLEDLTSNTLPRINAFTHIENGWGMWKVSTKENSEFIGWILIRPMAFFCEQPQLDNLEIGWRFKPSSWGKGYATEAATNIMSALVKSKKYQYVTAIAAEANMASINVMRKLGMKYLEKKYYQDANFQGEVIVYQIQLSQ
ncbi:MAG: GNAT family N-acetyltransferase [Parashewanella sp.]